MPGHCEESTIKATALRKCQDSVVSIISIGLLLTMYGVHTIRSPCELAVL